MDMLINFKVAIWRVAGKTWAIVEKLIHRQDILENEIENEGVISPTYFIHLFKIIL